MGFQNMKYIVVFTLVTALGCASEDAGKSQPVTPPKRIQAGGKTWTRQARLTQTDNRVLHRLFKSNRSVSDNPDFRGDPSVFRCENGARRYYWSTASNSNRRSAFLQVDAKGRYQKIGETDFSEM